MDAALSQADTGYMTKIKNSENSRWRTATILKMVNHDESFNFDDIWYVDVYFDSQNGRVAKKSQNLANPRRQTDDIVFGNIISTILPD